MSPLRSKTSKHSRHIKIATLAMPEKLLNELDQMVEDNTYPSRSEIVRAAIHDYALNPLPMPSHQPKHT
jgi:metal-responsive CopG/Arc/MetJ family transcriptional regulator